LSQRKKATVISVKKKEKRSATKKGYTLLFGGWKE